MKTDHGQILRQEGRNGVPSLPPHSALQSRPRRGALPLKANTIHV